ncbi:MAG: hypothetical protein [Podoviridae sp. cty5g4]|nr:MAG: hypothetical protein [Podoviridae sp. cty5g4]
MEWYEKRGFVWLGGVAIPYLPEHGEIKILMKDGRSIDITSIDHPYGVVCTIRDEALEIARLCTLDGEGEIKSIKGEIARIEVIPGKPWKKTPPSTATAADAIERAHTEEAWE